MIATLIALASGAGIGFIIASELSKPARQISTYDQLSKKHVFRVHSGFELREDSLVLYTTRDGEDIAQNYLLLDEPTGIKFDVRDDYVVEIKMSKKCTSKGNLPVRAGWLK